MLAGGHPPEHFEEAIGNAGSILGFNIRPAQQGQTSIQYTVDVYADAPGANHEQTVFSTIITFAHVDEGGNKQALPRKGPLRSEQDEL